MGGAKAEEPDDLDEPYTPSYRLPDYTTPIIPRIEVDPFGSSPAAEAPKKPARNCHLEAPHWVRYPDVR